MREQDLVGLGRRRAVGGLGDDLRLDVAGVAGRDLVLERGRDQDVALGLEDLGVRDVLGAGEALTVPCSFFQPMTRLMSRPAMLQMPPVESVTATTVAPSSPMSWAAIEPTLPKPWTATVAPWRSMPRWRGGLDDRVDAAAGRGLVAALGAAEAIGLPVTTPGTVWPTCME